MANKGIVFEREIVKLFRDNGYDVIRGAGSKGEVFGIKADLVATKSTVKNKKTAVMVIVQCKVQHTTRKSKSKKKAVDTIR